MTLLAARMARGDETAFAELYDACADRLFAYLTARLGSRDRAADVVQETFLRAVAARRRFRKVENPIAYIFQIARNEAARSIVVERRRSPACHPATDLVAADESEADRDQVELATAALNRIATDDRELVELKVFAGLTFREIGEVTGRPQGTVATRYRRAIEQLRPWLSKQVS